MATPTGVFSRAPSSSHGGIPLRLKALQFFFSLCILLGVVSAAHAQTPPQQYVYGSHSSLIAGFSKNGLTGALGAVPGSPANERFEGGHVAIDGQGKFLFVLNPQSNDISMFQIDQTSGALTEVPASPFTVPPTVNPNHAPTQPLSIATEKSGKFVYVGYYDGDVLGSGSVISLTIDTSGSSPVLVTQQSTWLSRGGAPGQLLADPKGLRLYVGMTQGQQGLNALQIGGAEVYSIDSSTGILSSVGFADISAGLGRSIAMDPQGRFFFGGWGQRIGFIDSCILSPVDGTARLPSSTINLGPNPGNFPIAMLVENSGRFLYMQQNIGVVVYSIDRNSGALTQVQGPDTTISLSMAVADPLGPYVYSLSGTGVAGYQVDQQSGNLTAIPGSPFNGGVSGSTSGIAISGNPPSAITGPAATIFPTTADFSSIAVGTSGLAQVFSVVNIGDQPLSINSISIAGTNASSFSQTNACTPTLAPNANCSVNITFQPANLGALSATLQVADNAPGSPQTLVLNGTGIPAVPVVTFSPPTPSFPPTVQGASSTPQTLTLISSGNAPLHVSSVALAGPNPSDFSFTNNCTVPVAAGANCTISLVFSPIAPGQRAANLVISDDASGSPQTISLNGTGIAVVHAITFSATALSFSPPAATQGTSSSPQTLTVTNSGNVPLNISSVSLTGPNPSDFIMPNGNCAGFYGLPSSSCSFLLVFSPIAPGQRTASLVYNDDASGSPHTVSLSGTGSPAFTAGPAPGSSTTATVTAGQTAQYLMQLTPGPGYSGTVSLTCSGAPLGAVCHVPPTVPLANGVPALFTVTVTTSGAAILPPSIPVRFTPLPGLRMLPLLALALVLLVMISNRRAFESTPYAKRIAWNGAFVAIVLCAGFTIAGCGAGSSSSVTPLPPVITPSGTSTIIITPSAMSPSGQPLQLQPIQLTLTVK